MRGRMIRRGRGRIVPTKGPSRPVSRNPKFRGRTTTRPATRPSPSAPRSMNPKFRGKFRGRPSPTRPAPSKPTASSSRFRGKLNPRGRTPSTKNRATRPTISVADLRKKAGARTFRGRPYGASPGGPKGRPRRKAISVADLRRKAGARTIKGKPVGASPRRGAPSRGPSRAVSREELFKRAKAQGGVIRGGKGNKIIADFRKKPSGPKGPGGPSTNLKPPTATKPKLTGKAAMIARSREAAAEKAKLMAKFGAPKPRSIRGMSSAERKKYMSAMEAARKKYNEFKGIKPSSKSSRFSRRPQPAPRTPAKPIARRGIPRRRVTPVRRKP